MYGDVPVLAGVHVPVPGRVHVPRKVRRQGYKRPAEEYMYLSRDHFQGYMYPS